MRLKTLLPCLAATLAFASCSKANKSPEAASEEKAAENNPLALSDAPPLDSAKANELWALAPDKAIMGAVAMPGAGARLQASFMEAIAVAEMRPFGKKIIGDMREQAQSEDLNPFDMDAFKKMGLDLNLGAAMFMVKEKQGFAILPVVDRAAFRAFTKGSLETMDGLEVDQHDDDFFCTQKDLYVCASSIGELKEFGHKVNGALAKRVAALPALYRGDAEFVINVAALQKLEPSTFDEDFYQYFGSPELGVLALRYGNGSFTARGWFQATPKGMLEGANSVPNALAKAAAAQNPSALFQLRVPPSAWQANLPKEDQIIPGGLSLQKDILGNLTGEFLGIAASSVLPSGTLSIGLKDAAPFKTLLNMGCGMAGVLGEGVKVTPGDGTCSAMVDFSKLPLPDPSIAKIFPEPLPVAIEVKADQLAITIGKVGPAKKGAAMGALGTDLVNNKWSFSVWAEGISIASAQAIPWKELDMLPPDALEGVKLGIWMVAHVYELGMAGAIRDDGVHGVMHLTTYAGDPPEAYKAYQGAVQQSLDSDDATTAFAALREKWPNTMAGRQGTSGGSMMVAGITGALAAIAIPAFVKYKERSQETQQELEAAFGAMNEASETLNDAEGTLQDARGTLKDAKQTLDEAKKAIDKTKGTRN